MRRIGHSGPRGLSSVARHCRRDRCSFKSVSGDPFHNKGRVQLLNCSGNLLKPRTGAKRLPRKRVCSPLLLSRQRGFLSLLPCFLTPKPLALALVVKRIGGSHMDAFYVLGDARGRQADCQKGVSSPWRRQDRRPGTRPPMQPPTPLCAETARLVKTGAWSGIFAAIRLGIRARPSSVHAENPNLGGLVCRLVAWGAMSQVFDVGFSKEGSLLDQISFRNLSMTSSPPRKTWPPRRS